MLHVVVKGLVTTWLISTSVGLCCTHNLYSMILVTNLTLMIHKVNLLCVSMNALFVLNGFLAKMLLLVVASTFTTHLALHTMLILMHVAKLMITRKHGTQINYCPWGFGHWAKCFDKLENTTTSTHAMSLKIEVWACYFR
jgi:hypothetical protein